MIHRPQAIRLPGVKFGFKGFFTVELIDAKTGLIKRRLEFANLITDAGLNALATVGIDNLMNQYMGVGTGATAPANGDTTLQTEIAPASTNRTNSNGGIAEVYGAGPSNAYWYRRITRLFVEAQANGNLTELGLFSASTAGTMWARQLFKDVGGTPTVITKTVTDQLRVTYEVRLYNPASATINPFTISGSNYSVTTAAVNIGSARPWGHDGSSFSVMVAFRGDQGLQNALDSNTIASPPAGTFYAPTSLSIAAYVAGNFYRDYTVVFDPGVANPAGGIGSIVTSLHGTTPNVGSAVAIQQAFTPKLPKDNTKRLTLINRISWGRYP